MRQSGRVPTSYVPYTNQCEGCVGISDDIVVYGSNEEEHEGNLAEFLKIARQEGLKINSKKCIIKCQQIHSFRRIFTDQGVLPDPANVKDIIKLSTPENKQDLQRFSEMVTFLSNHIPRFSDATSELRALMKQDVPS